jgi:hypothetical protein
MKNQNPVLTNKHTGWDRFNHVLECNVNLSVSLKTTDQLEKELNAFTTAIQEAVWDSTLAIKRKLKKQHLKQFSLYSKTYLGPSVMCDLKRTAIIGTRLFFL